MPFVDVVDELLLFSRFSVVLTVVSFVCGSLPVKNRGAGCGGINFIGVSTEFNLSFVSVASSLADEPSLVLRNLLRPFNSLSLRKSGNSKLISVPRWSSNRKRWARFRPSSKSGILEDNLLMLRTMSYNRIWLYFYLIRRGAI